MSRKLKKTHLFSKDVSSLMYAYGDVPQPLPESVQCLDELVSSYLVDICMEAFRTAQTVRRNKIKVEDFKFALRRDSVKLGRAEELIKLSRIITDAKKLFKNSDGKSLKRMREDETQITEAEIEDEGDDEYMSTDGADNFKKVKEVKKRKKKNQ